MSFCHSLYNKMIHEIGLSEDIVVIDYDALSVTEKLAWNNMDNYFEKKPIASSSISYEKYRTCNPDLKDYNELSDDVKKMWVSIDKKEDKMKKNILTEKVDPVKVVKEKRTKKALKEDKFINELEVVNINDKLNKINILKGKGTLAKSDVVQTNMNEKLLALKKLKGQ